MMTTEGWIDTMNHGIDSAGIEKQPIKENKEYAALYFITFMILGSFLLINLFTAVITDNFNKIKEQHEIGAGEAVNPNQKQWVDVQNIALSVHPRKKINPPVSGCRGKVYRIVNSTMFDIGIIAVIILNTIVIACTHATMSDTFKTVILALNYMFVVVYNIEMILKVSVLRCKYFTNDSWNVFDFICVMASDLAFILELNGIKGPVYSIVLFLRAFRMVRIIKYINTYGSAETINTLVNAAPQIRNILTLIVLITFIYAALGLNLFGTSMYREYYNEQNNFKNIFNALILLIRSMTGEDWNKIMHDLASKDDYDGIQCVDTQSYDEIQRDGTRGCGTLLAFPFFISYYLLNAMIVLDLSIGVFITALSDARKLNQSVFNRKIINKFIELWSDYDPDSTHWISIDQLAFLMFEMPIPFGQDKIAPNYHTAYAFDTIYEKRLKENILILNAKYNRSKINSRKNEIKWIKFHQNYYILNEYKGLLIKETRIPLILRNVDIHIS